MSQVAQLLSEFAAGRSSAADELFPLVYEQLRALAGAYFRQERSEHTLQPTALVHEAYVKLAAQSGQSIAGKAHFLAIAARVMRNILIDHARQKASDKRGGGRTRITFAEGFDLPVGESVEVEEVDQALRELQTLSPRTAEVVELRFFGGLTFEESAEALNTSVSTVEREWRFARAWLMDQLRPQGQA